MGWVHTRPRPSTSGAVIFYGVTRSSRRPRKNKLSAVGDSQPAAPLDDQSLRPSSSASEVPKSLVPREQSKYADSQHLIGDFKPSATGLLPSVTSTGIVALAKDISLLFSNVPYIQVVSSVVQQIIQVANDVQVNKDRTRELTDKVMIYANVIFGALGSPQMDVEQGLSGLEADLLHISSVLQSIYQMLQSLSDSSLSSRFNMLKSSIVLRAKVSTVEASATKHETRSHTPTRIRSKPRVFGRETEIKQIVTIIQELSPARVAILGSGGIGKTSLALSLLHDEQIAARFQRNRLFVSCEAARSADHIIDDLVLALDIPSHSNFRYPLEVVLDHLGKSPHFIVLDNLETPWESLSARAGVEDLLRDLTSLDTVTLVVTMRGSQCPSTVNWSELLPPLQPVSLDAAVEIFTSISRKTDEFTTKLVNAVDCVPLAVTLLASLASVDGETTEGLWQRWCTEQVAMVENGDDRLSSFENSIELSLTSPRMRRDDEALKLLSIISLLPDEISSQT
ncbi:hypothetical protein H0H92_002745, partial [Tricholoma furcatifolium]